MRGFGDVLTTNYSPGLRPSGVLDNQFLSPVGCFPLFFSPPGRPGTSEVPPCSFLGACHSPLELSFCRFFGVSIFDLIFDPVFYRFLVQKWSQNRRNTNQKSDFLGFCCWLYFSQGHGTHFYNFSTFVSTMSTMLDMRFISYFTIRNALRDIIVLSRFNQKVNTKINDFGSDFQSKFHRTFTLFASKLLQKTTSTKQPVFYRFVHQIWSPNGARNYSKIIKMG